MSFYKGSEGFEVQGTGLMSLPQINEESDEEKELVSENWNELMRLYLQKPRSSEGKIFGEATT